MAHAGHGAPPPPTDGLVWLNQPVLFHSSRDTSKNDYSKLTAEQLATINRRFTNWYTADWDYGYGTIGLFCAAIGIFALINLSSKYRYWRAVSNKKTPTSFLRLIGFYRFLTSKSYYVPLFDYHSPPLGAILIVGSLIVFFFAFLLAAKPYYWPSPLMGGSPPIATRSGWAAIAMMPFLFAFASKYNLVGMLTGVSHEKLQVMHRWTAWIMYIITLIHTFPFIIVHRNAGDMQANWNGKVWYWTGTAALLPQTWLVLMSWGPIRNRYYETFKKLHYLSVIIFFFFLFIHCNFRLSSWDYLIATGAICLATFIVRFGGMLFVNGVNHVATLEHLDDRIVKVTIPTRIQWEPGQHFFVRFLGMGVHAWTSHPFTASSEPQSQRLEFYIRTHRGITSRLASFAQSARTSRVLLDGPYGTNGADLTVYDRVVMISGGAGLTNVLSNLRYLVRRRDRIVTKNVHVVWATPYHRNVEYFRSVFEQIFEVAGKAFLGIDAYVTGKERPQSPESESDGSSEKSGAGGLRVSGGRPNLKEIVQSHCTEPGSVAFIVCGPDSMAYDVRNAVASCQLDVATGSAAQKDIYLHVESFGW